MSVTKFLTPEKLFEYLDQEVADALKRHGIRRMFDYAWEGEDEPSDNFIGLAKWSVDGLHHLDYEETDGAHYSRAEHEQLFVALTDLEGLMDMSALSIGQTLWLADQVKADVLGKNQFFWLNYINSLTLLGMASDRVRDLFMAIYFRRSFKKYRQERDGVVLLVDGVDLAPDFYQYPFAHASLENTEDKTRSQLTCLSQLGAEIYKFRRERNRTVHDIATHEARLTKLYFADADRRGDKARQVVTPSGSVEHFNAITTSHERTIDGAVQTSTDWYMKLVMATSHIFDIEYELRVRTRFTPA